MKVRTDFVTNSSSSSFTVSLAVGLKNGETISYTYEAYEENGYPEVFVHAGPDKMAKCESIEELLSLIKSNITFNENEPSEDETAIVDVYGEEFIEKMEELTSVDDINTIILSADREATDDTSASSRYTFDKTTGSYKAEYWGDDSDEMFGINGSRGGEILFSLPAGCVVEDNG